MSRFGSKVAFYARRHLCRWYGGYNIMEEKEKAEKNPEKEIQGADSFSIKEIVVEEIAVDGICGVY